MSKNESYPFDDFHSRARAFEASARWSAIFNKIKFIRPVMASKRIEE